MTSRWPFVVALCTAAAACGSDDPPGVQSEPVECGTLTCSATEMCVAPRPVDPWFEGPAARTCDPIPAGCEGFRLCSCPALSGDYGDLAIVGCSLLGERSIYVADLTCGDRRCDDAELCVVERQGPSGPIVNRACRALSVECMAGERICGDGGCMSGASIDGRPVIGCLEAEYVRAVVVDAG
jgi:hypothetical protein